MDSIIFLIICAIFNTWLSRNVKSLPVIIIWLLVLPVFLAMSLISGIVTIKENYQFFTVSIIYILVWWRGAFIFKPKQYKAAISCIGAVLISILTFVAYFSYIKHYIDFTHNDLYKIFSMILSPLIIAGAWGKFFIDLREMLEEESRNLKGCFKELVIGMFSKEFIDFINLLMRAGSEDLFRSENGMKSKARVNTFEKK